MAPLSDLRRAAGHFALRLRILFGSADRRDKQMLLYINCEYGGEERHGLEREGQVA
ncbi:MAG: hypothetical protein LC808_26990 [Actinobacteria bacterium]|nr:hypothetical protein [Actinomycetota bacterium]